MPPNTQTQQPQSNSVRDTALVGTVAAILGSSLIASAAFPALSSALAIRDRLGKEALQIVLSILEEFPPPPMQGVGAAQSEMIRENVLRRSAYLLSALQRLRTELADARAHGENLSVAANTARYAERRNFALHIQASAQRVLAASDVDALAGQYGTTLGWYAKNDKRTTAECRNANGKNFSAINPPTIGWPGVVHVHCRCRPGAPHRGASMLPSKGLA